MPNKYERLLALLEPFLITYHLDKVDLKQKIFGQSLCESNLYNPLDINSKSFVDKIFKMDSLTFGGQGMGMDHWVFLDCSVMPGFVFGYQIRGGHLEQRDRELLGIQKDEVFPISMYIAIPTMDKEIWFGHNLSSLNGVIDYPLAGLGYLTKAAALKLFKVKILRGATQWDSKAINVHLKFSSLKLLSAYTPIHSKENTFCYESYISSDNLMDKKEFNDNFDFELDPTLDEIKKLQKRIQQGEHFSLVGLSLGQMLIKQHR